jgi:hypothetical protein
MMKEPKSVPRTWILVVEFSCCSLDAMIGWGSVEWIQLAQNRGR